MWAHFSRRCALTGIRDVKQYMKEEVGTGIYLCADEHDLIEEKMMCVGW